MKYCRLYFITIQLFRYETELLKPIKYRNINFGTMNARYLYSYCNKEKPYSNNVLTLKEKIKLTIFQELVNTTVIVTYFSVTTHSLYEKEKKCLLGKHSYRNIIKKCLLTKKQQFETLSFYNISIVNYLYLCLAHVCTFS